MSRYAYRRPDDVPARPVASGGYNVVHLGAMAMIPEMYGEPISMRAPACPAWGCSGPPPVRFMPYGSPGGGVYNNNGATASVPQPPPSSGGTLTVPNPGPLPISPQPSPTVAVSPAQTAPSLTTPGTTLDSTGASTTIAPTSISDWLTSIETWLGESTLMAGLPNWGIAGVGALAVWWMMGKKGRR